MDQRELKLKRNTRENRKRSKGEVKKKDRQLKRSKREGRVKEMERTI
jgi:hypothetical protein